MQSVLATEVQRSQYAAGNGEIKLTMSKESTREELRIYLPICTIMT